MLIRNVFLTNARFAAKIQFSHKIKFPTNLKIYQRIDNKTERKKKNPAL